MSKKRIIIWTLIIAFIIFIGFLLNSFLIIKATQTTKEPYWEDDGIFLLREVGTGELHCFGCGLSLCIDPAPIGLEEVKESFEIYCNNEFEVVKTKE